MECLLLITGVTVEGLLKTAYGVPLARPYEIHRSRWRHCPHEGVARGGRGTVGQVRRGWAAQARVRRRHRPRRPWRAGQVRPHPYDVVVLDRDLPVVHGD